MYSWGILSPLAKKQGWAPGIVNDWKNGSRGWIVWISLAIMLADSVVSLSLLAGDTIVPLVKKQLIQNRWLRAHGSKFLAIPVEERVDAGIADDEADSEDEDADAPPEEQIDIKTFFIALSLTTGLCIGTIRYCFPQVPVYLTVIALVVAFLMSIMAARALGQTDLNPVSGISAFSLSCAHKQVT